MTDTSIRRVTIAEQAQLAAAKFMETGEKPDNPHAGTADEQAWRSAFERWLLALSAADVEGGA
jgi:hypothetical protein